MTQSDVELKNGRFVHYAAWNLHINPKAHKLWAARVTGYDPSTKFNWQQDFLGTTSLDDDRHYDVQGIAEGDVLRVKAASHSNDKTTCMEAEEKTDERMVCEHLSDSEAIEMVQADDSDERGEIEREIEAVLADCDADELRKIRDYADMLKGADDPMDVTISVGGSEGDE